MSRHAVPHVSTDRSRRSVSAGRMRARVFDIDVNRPKRIDRFIDYFGSGGARRPVVASDLRGESVRPAEGTLGLEGLLVSGEWTKVP